MENKKKGLYGLIFVSMLGVMVLAGIGFAALSQTLTINPSGAIVDPASWTIKFDDLVKASITGDAQEGTAPKIEGDKSTVISPFSVTLKKPGDQIVYTFNVKNTGNIDAVLKTYTLGAVTVNGGTPEDAAIVEGTIPTDTPVDGDQKNLIYTLTYDDGDPITTGVLLAKETGVKQLKLTVGLNSHAIELPENPVTVKFGQTTFLYEQAPNQP